MLVNKNGSGDTPVGASAKLNTLLNSKTALPGWEHTSVNWEMLCFIFKYSDRRIQCVQMAFVLFKKTKQNYSADNRQSQNLLHKVLFKCRGKVVKKKRSE